MKKPPGKADPGWYESPTLEGYFQYWDGEYWTENKIINDGLDPKTIPPASDVILGKFLLTKPYYTDGALLVILGLSLLTAISTVRATYTDVSNLNLIGFVALALDFILPIIFYWVIFLVYLIPRRIKHKRKLAKINGKQ